MEGLPFTDLSIAWQCSIPFADETRLSVKPAPRRSRKPAPKSRAAAANAEPLPPPAALAEGPGDAPAAEGPGEAPAAEPTLLLEEWLEDLPDDADILLLAGHVNEDDEDINSEGDVEDLHPSMDDGDGHEVAEETETPLETAAPAVEVPLVCGGADACPPPPPTCKLDQLGGEQKGGAMASIAALVGANMEEAQALAAEVAVAASREKSEDTCVQIMN